MHGRREITSPKSNLQRMHIERDLRPAMTQKTIRALGLRIHKLDRVLSLYPIPKLSEFMPHCLLLKGG